MQYVTVVFNDSRDVFIDGNLAGKTNTVLRVNEGSHLFDLGSPLDYRPESQRIKVTGTSSIKPMEVTFEAL